MVGTRISARVAGAISWPASWIASNVMRVSEAWSNTAEECVGQQTERAQPMATEGWLHAEDRYVAGSTVRGDDCRVLTFARQRIRVHDVRESGHLVDVLECSEHLYIAACTQGQSAFASL